MSTALRVLPSELLYAIAGLAVVAILAFVLGFVDVLSVLASAVTIAVSLLVIYLFYRLVVATERIARATERIAGDPSVDEPSRADD
jgi:uncharacterized membrane protein